MKIYTSYFGNLRKLTQERIVPVSIARYPPKWYGGHSYTALAPTAYMLSGSCSHEEYLSRYAELTWRMNAADVVKDLEQMSQGRDVALLCFEKPGQFCHRRLAADWLHKELGIDVEEFGVSKNPVMEQGSLF